MGEIADAMLDGTLCETCGEFIGEPVGHPRRCGGCETEQADDFDIPGPCEGCGHNHWRAGALGKPLWETCTHCGNERPGPLARPVPIEEPGDG